MARRAGPLLPIHLLAGSIDLAAVLDVMGAALTLGELPAYTAVQDVGPRLKAEDGIRQIDRTRRRAVEGHDLELHFRRAPSRPLGHLREARPRFCSRPLQPPQCGTCPAWGLRPEASSSPHHEE